MFKEIFRFELHYRKTRAATYIYFGIIFLLCFLGVTSPVVSIGGAVGQIKANSPYVLTMMTLIMSFAMSMITSAVMGVSIIRDFDHNTEALLFSTPMKKRDYLMGRFWGSFFVSVLIFCGVWMGFMSGFAIGEYLPWDVDWKERGILTFDAWHYFQPFLLFVLTNLFITGSLFFMSGALGRKPVLIYTQGILLIILYEMAASLLRDIEHREIAALVDPFGFYTFEYVTRYWTPAEKNSMLIPLEGMVLYNRLLWMGIAIVALVVTYFGFSFNVVRNPIIRRKSGAVVRMNPNEARALPVVQQIINGRTYLMQLWKLAKFYFTTVCKEVPFIAIVVSGMLLLFINALNLNELFGTKSYPTTYTILNLLASFNLFFLIITIFYSGELVWKERSVGVNLITDALPMPAFVGLLSKFLGLLMVYIVILLVLILCGITIQAAYGYYNFQLPVYFKSLFTQTLSFLVLYTLLAFFIHVMVNNKFLGFALCIVFFIARTVLDELGLEHSLFQFASGSLGSYSDMNAFGHFVMPFSWIKLYWLAFAMILFALSVVFSVRGSEAVMKMRWKAGRFRLTRPMRIFSFTSITVFIFSGAYVYYNTNVLNKFENSDTQKDRRARYEKELKQYEFIPQPKIVEANLQVDIYPYDRDFTAKGYYYLKNKTSEPIKHIHLQENTDNNVSTGLIEFDREVDILQSYDEFRYTIFELTPALEPGDSMKLKFEVTFETRGFEEGNSNTDVVFNGTFFNNLYFPQLGYDVGYELSDDDDRLKHGLKEKERMLERDDPRGKAMSLFGDDADHIRFHIVLSTESDQIAIAPGYLQKTWEENGRKFFHYKMDAPMCNFYSIVSARYAVKRDKWNDVNLEIYYHPGHEYNLDRMMQGMKDALEYYSKNFSPFQFGQMRIMEFPRYASFAQSYANTVPYSEGIGFIAKMDDPEKDIDYVYYVTAHEVAHQWWGHQVMEARVKGNAMLSESMSQYSALMVMKHALPPEMIERYLKYELDSYLAGRSAETKKEQPLELVEQQGYIHYRKASLIFFALQDYIGEENVNKAFRQYLKEWAFRDAPYPTSADLLKHIRQVTPDSLQYLIHDMFETITLFENKTEKAEYREIDSTHFEVTLTVSAEKLRADSLGMETPVAINDWIDIGIYSRGEDRKDKLIYLQKHKFTQKDNTITIIVNERPYKAGIDPLHKLIDRHSDDNTKRLVEVKPST